MHLLTKRISIAWLVLALIVAPLQAMAMPLAADMGGDCTMMQPAQSDAENPHQMGKHTAVQCDHCNGQCCDNDQCGEYGCFLSHFQSSIPVSHLDVPGNPLDSVHPDYTQSTTSHAPNPPFRPPV